MRLLPDFVDEDLDDLTGCQGVGARQGTAEMRDAHAMLRTEMRAGFERLTEAIESLSGSHHRLAERVQRQRNGNGTRHDPCFPVSPTLPRGGEALAHG